MTTTQKIIKYVAMGLAIGLIVAIFSGIGQVIIGISLLTDFAERDDTIGEMTEYAISQNIDSIEIFVDTANLIFEVGDEFSVHSNFNKMEIEDKDGKLSINEKSHNVFDVGNNGTITVFVPEDEQLDKLSVSTGASSVSVAFLNCRKLNFNLGAGNVSITDIDVTEKAEIDCGIGELRIQNGDINNLELSHGVGKADINAVITGNSEVEAGIGDLRINIPADKTLYTVEAESGIGPVKLDGERVENEIIIGNGKNFLKLDGGIGSVRLSFETE